MELSELQKRVDAWIREYGVRYFSELTNMAILTEEVGGLARVMARKYGDQSLQSGRKGEPGGRNGRRTVGIGLPGEPDGSKPHRSPRSQLRQENGPRQGAAPQQSQAMNRNPEKRG